ncbi:hypothetical protein LTR36_003633 [Oleoguttula mirabilis]|uniref:Uncharacterized protein n=1 Tax=Oleoguttula mirabilis TaxID=1507867 RepID=A0AAV9JIV7_9PEZI|nr:hypothetical protein LTR36_003633 [Oleoguttula mirabilis]
MQRFHSPSGFSSEASISGRPHTPPYTPRRAKGKRRLERADSPASSVHPAETTSPAKKIAKRATVDNVRVEELAEGDVGFMTDIDVVYPEELEEVPSSDGDDELSPSDDEHSDTGMTRRMSRLHCGDENAEVEFEKGRRLRRMSKRMSSRIFKRSHSQSVNSDAETTDVDAMADQDIAASQRRLRRRVRGPREAELVFEEMQRSSPEASGVDVNVRASRVGEPITPERDVDIVKQVQSLNDDAMEVDDAR